MGDSSQPAFLKKVFSSDLWRPSSSRPKALITGAALEGSSKDILDVLVGKGFEVFLSDIDAAKDVNLVWDLENKPEDRFLSSFDLVVSCSVLEHIRRPHLACQHLLDVLKNGGLMYLSLPWIWRYHKYPDDYHRFHASTLDHLCKDAALRLRAWSTSPDCKLHSYDPNFDQSHSRIIDGVKYLPYLMIHEARVKL